jgi:hypothetical protein
MGAFAHEDPTLGGIGRNPGFFLFIFVMKIRLITQNVQGLNASLAPARVRNFYSSSFKNIEILCLQEHKLRGKKLDELGFKIWRQAHYFGCEASPGYNHQDGVDRAGKGGLCMFISPKINP